MSSNTNEEAPVEQKNTELIDYEIDDSKRYIIICAGIYICIAVSSIYGFGVYSNYIRNTYNFNQQEMTTISTVGSVVGYFTIPAGFLFDYFGPKYVIPFATFFSALGYLLYGFTFLGNIHGTVAGFSIYYGLLFFGSSSYDGSVIMPALLNFPKNRGETIIIMKTFAGLGTSLLTCLYTAFMFKKYTTYMFFLASLYIIFGFFGILFIRCPPFFFTHAERKKLSTKEIEERLATMPIYYSTPTSSKRVFVGIGTVVVMLIYLTTVSVCDGYLHLSRRTHIGLGVGAVFITSWFLLMLIPCDFMEDSRTRAYKESMKAKRLLNSSTTNSEKEPIAFYPEENNDTTGNNDNNKHQTEVNQEDSHAPAAGAGTGQNVTAAVLDFLPNDYDSMTLEQLRTRREELRVLEPQYHNTFFRDLLVYDVWLIWWNNFCVWGSGIVAITNSSQIYDALVGKGNYQDSTNALYVAIIGVGSALGRITMGVFEIVRERRTRETRPLITAALPVSAIATGLGFLFFLIIPSSGLILPFLVASFGNGYSWGNTAMTIRAMFSKEIGLHYNFCFFGGLIAIICLNRFAFGEIFTKEGHKMGEGDKCYGLRCVQTCFILIVCLNASAAVGCFIVHLNFKRFCRKFHEENDLEIEKINTIEQERLAAKQTDEPAIEK